MIPYRRLLIVAAGITGLLMLLLTACSLSTAAPQPSQAPSAVASAAPSVEPSIAATEAAASVAAAPSAAPTSSVPQGGALTLRIPADIPDLKPWDLRSRGEEYVADLMYNGLIRLDPQLQPQPDLASEWDIAPDGTTITFTLQSGVTWHDGAPLSAEDVVWTLRTLQAITPTNSLLYDLRSAIREVYSPLEGTVIMSLTRPDAPLLAELAVPILPRHLLQPLTPEQFAALNFWDQPIGTGPFKLDAREANQSISFVRNPSYARGAPHLDQVVLVVAPDTAVAATALEDQRLLLGEFPRAGDPVTSTADTIERGSYPENGWYGVAFNTRPDRLFADGRLRNALAQAVDVNALVGAATGGAGQPLAAIVSRVSGLYPPGLDVTPPNPDAARQLLEDAGWTPGPDGVRQKDGRALRAQLWVRGDDPRRTAAAQQIADAAAGIGMQLEVVPADFRSVILAKLAPPYDWDLLLGSWVNAPNSAGFPTNRYYDPDDYDLLHSSLVWGGQGDTRTGLRNITGFTNGDYDAAADAARSAYTPESRAEALAAGQAVLQRERPYLLLWTDTIDVLVDKRVAVDGGTVAINSPRYLWNVEEWYLTPE